jgi:hypothetical protein
MTYTIWSQGRRYEWIAYEGERVVARSGLIFTSYARAMQKLIVEAERLAS